MKDHDAISDEQLYAFLDNQLAPEERAQILDAVNHDPAVAARVAKLRQTKDWLNFAYQDPPRLNWNPLSAAVRAQGRPLRRLAMAGLLFIGGGLGGGVMINALHKDAAPRFQQLAEYRGSEHGGDKILLHISTMNQQQIDRVLNKADEILKNNKSKELPVTVEIIANAEGLGMLRTGSPQAQRIHALAREHEHLSFLACGIAIQHFSLKEGKAVQLLPEATPVDAALEQILRRLKEGWIYIRGS